MKIDERRRAVVEYLKLMQNEIVPILDIADEVNASVRTIKNDLNFLTDFCPIKTFKGIGGGVQFTQNKVLKRIISIISSDCERIIDSCRFAFSLGFFPICFQLYFSVIFGEVKVDEEYLLDLEYFVIEKSHEIWFLGNINDRNDLLIHAKKNLKIIKYCGDRINDN